MSTLFCFSLLSLLQAAAIHAHAGAVAVSGPVAGRLQIVAEDATVEEVLARLAKHLDFVVDGGLQVSASRRISGRIEGSLDDVLTRILRSESFTVVYAPSAPASVARVVLVGARSRTNVADGPSTRDDRMSGGAIALPGRAANSTSEARGVAPSVAAQGDASVPTAPSAPPLPVPAQMIATPLILDTPSNGPVPTAGAVAIEGNIPTAVISAGTLALQAMPSGVQTLAVAVLPSGGDVGFAPGSHPR